MKNRIGQLLLCGTLVLGLTGVACADPEQAKESPKAEAQEAPVTMIGKMKVEDVREGSGLEAKKGKQVVVNYHGTLENGTVFDSSYQRNQPFEFKLGAGRVIQGWDKGFAGMRVGGKRVLTIPPEMAYGAQGVPPVIPPNATLQFEVELLDVK